MRARSLRVITLDGEPWFLAADVCHTLGMSIRSGTMKYLGRLDPSERRRIDREEIGGGLGLGRGVSSAYAISESGLYKVVMRSDKPIAKPFQDWVTKEVLPAIRKTGPHFSSGGSRFPDVVPFPRPGHGKPAPIGAPSEMT